MKEASRADGRGAGSVKERGIGLFDGAHVLDEHGHAIKERAEADA